MTACVWFSYAPDFPHLRKSVSRVRELDPKVSVVVALHHGEADPGIPGAKIVRTGFDRGVHLDGPEVAQGVAEVLAGEWSDLVVKIDSDMMLKRAFWQDGPRVFRRRNQSFVGLYALPLPVPQQVARTFRTLPDRCHHEAIAICSRAQLLAAANSIPLTTEQLDGFTPDFVEFLPSVRARS